MAWIRTSEELPEHYDRDILFVVLDRTIVKRALMYLGGYDGKVFWHGTLDYRENEVLAWCYAPALPDWVEDVYWVEDI